MYYHFLEGLRYHDLFLSRPPRRVLELGALNGENTLQLLSLALDIPDFRLTVVTDGRVGEEKPRDPCMTWIWGVSWVEMDKMPEASFEAVLIDTDHNYYTLKKELVQCARLLAPPGWILMHDTVTFGRATGRQASFLCGVPYPLADIIADQERDLGMLDAIREFLREHQDFMMEKETMEEHGAMALRRTA